MDFKNCTANFYIPMNSCDSAQIADMIDIYILDTLGRIIDIKPISSYNLKALSSFQIVMVPKFKKKNIKKSLELSSY